MSAVAASADTLRIVVDRALVWNRPSGASVVVTQLSRGQVVEIVRQVDEWYEVVVPGRERRTGFVRASQVELIPAAGDAATGQPPAGRPATPARPAARVRDPRSFLHIGAGYRFGIEPFTRTTSAFTDDYAEAGTLVTDYGDGSGVEFDFMAGARIGRQFGAAFGVSFYPRSDAVAITADVPHPFYFDQPREALFEDSDLSGREVGIHLSLAWIRHTSPATRVMIFGGPSLFKVTQDVVTDLALTSVYPFDEVTVTRAITEERDGLGVGFHIGADVSHFFTPSVGVGVIARYSRGSLEFDDDTIEEMKGGAGAVHIGGGLRFRF